MMQWEHSFGRKNCFALAFYFFPFNQIRLGFGLYLPFHLSIDLWFCSLVIYWKDTSDEEVIALLKHNGGKG